VQNRSRPKEARAAALVTSTTVYEKKPREEFTFCECRRRWGKAGEWILIREALGFLISKAVFKFYGYICLSIFLDYEKIL
jgi:hypothetical protein